MIAPLTRTATPEQVRAIWQNRYTAKDYDASRDVSKEDLDAILESAHLSASSMGMEPWHFLVLRRDTPLFDAVVAHCWGYHASPSHLVLLLGRDGQAFTTRSDYVAHIHVDVQERDPEKLDARYDTLEHFLRADLGLTSDDAVNGWVDRQVYIALGSMLISSAMLGVDSTAVEGLTVSAVEDVLVRSGVLDRDEFHLVCALELGYTSREGHRDKTRRPLDEVVTRL
ncbi:MAG: nitroreductase family protein [Actinomycetaceae bacterium]|nr:nitroreductase family protein [Actinomycetaceae bacterium]MDU0970663.1 nitroreductase family protein [Actinomycetaceae bacterium]